MLSKERFSSMTTMMCLICGSIAMGGTSLRSQCRRDSAGRRKYTAANSPCHQETLNLLLRLFGAGEMANPAHAARGVDDDFEVALLALGEHRSIGGVGLAGSVCEGQSDGAGALNLEVVVVSGVGVERLRAEARAGVVDLDEVQGRRAVVLDGGFDKGGAAGGEAERSEQSEKKSAGRFRWGHGGPVTTRSCAHRTVLRSKIRAERT